MKVKKFQESAGVLSDYLKRRRYAAVVEEIAGDKRLVLDIGCGEGGFKNFLPKTASYFGLDVKSNKNKNIFACDVTKGFPLKVSNMKFDYIISLAFVEHIKDVASFLGRCKKVLKDDGKIVITTPHPIGRKVHEIGAALGLFSKEAAEEHEKFLNKRDLDKICSIVGLKVGKYKRFLFGFNQLFVIKNVR